jgi:hypothetical protein
VTRVSRCRLAALAIAVALVLGATASLWSHPAPSSAIEPGVARATPEPSRPTPVPTPAAPAPAEAPAPQRTPWVPLAGLVIAAVVSWPLRRGAVAPALAALLVVFAFEDALHSVHHGFDPAETADCVIAVASAHVPATTIDAAPVADLAALSGEDARLEPHRASLPARPPSTDQERAPPA